MTLLRNLTPTPTQFADAHKQQFADVLRKAAGADGRVSKAELEQIKQKADPEWLISDNAIDVLEKSGQKTMSVEKLIGLVHAEVKAAAEAVAGANGVLSLVEARLLPPAIKDDFMFLRAQGVADRVQPTDVKAWVRAAVIDVLDNNSLPKLPGAPWQVRGKRPIIEHIDHPATQSRVSGVYVVDDNVYFSRAAPRGPGVQYVGWYDLGKLPPHLQQP